MGHVDGSEKGLRDGHCKEDGRESIGGRKQGKYNDLNAVRQQCFLETLILVYQVRDCWAADTQFAARTG